jgi:hypothetical protein
MLKNLFGDIALDQSIRNLLRNLGRLTFVNGDLRVVLASAGQSTQAVSGTVSVTPTTGPAYQQSQDNFNMGFRSRISKS